MFNTFRDMGYTDEEIIIAQSALPAEAEQNFSLIIEKLIDNRKGGTSFS
jgi:hypothetical protein